MRVAEGNDGSSLWSVVATVLFGGWLGELLAFARSGRGAGRRWCAGGSSTWSPVWMLVVLGIAVAGGLVRHGIRGQWAAFSVTAACALVVVALAVERPSEGEPVVDLVLRTRSPRGATGRAIAAPYALP